MTTVLHLSKLQLSLIVGVPCAVVALVALVGIYICWRTCRRTVTSERRIVYNSYFSCTVFAIGFMIGPIVVLIVGFSIFHTAQVASFVMLLVGAALALIGITLTGHSTIELVHCLLPPRVTPMSRFIHSLSRQLMWWCSPPLLYACATGCHTASCCTFQAILLCTYLLRQQAARACMLLLLLLLLLIGGSALHTTQCYPRSRRARFDDVRGFTMCVNGIRNKVMYQVCMPHQPAHAQPCRATPPHTAVLLRSCNYCALMAALSH